MRCWLGLSPLVIALAACSREGPAPSPWSSAGPVPPACAALEQIDQRTPVPLLPMMAHHQKQNMRDHLVAVQEIVAALANDDFATIESAAARIGMSEQMGHMCTQLGAGAPAFAEQALAFHRTADRIGTAAREQDRTRVLTELGATLQTCTACHATWKQAVVDDATWSQVTSPLTSSSASPMSAP